MTLTGLCIIFPDHVFLNPGIPGKDLPSFSEIRSKPPSRLEQRETLPCVSVTRTREVENAKQNVVEYIAVNFLSLHRFTKLPLTLSFRRRRNLPSCGVQSCKSSINLVGRETLPCVSVIVCRYANNYPALSSGASAKDLPLYNALNSKAILSLEQREMLPYVSVTALKGLLAL